MYVAVCFLSPSRVALSDCPNNILALEGIKIYYIYDMKCLFVDSVSTDTEIIQPARVVGCLRI